MPLSLPLRPRRAPPWGYCPLHQGFMDGSRTLERDPDLRHLIDCFENHVVQAGLKFVAEVNLLILLPLPPASPVPGFQACATMPVCLSVYLLCIRMVIVWWLEDSQQELVAISTTAWQVAAFIL